MPILAGKFAQCLSRDRALAKPPPGAKPAGKPNPGYSWSSKHAIKPRLPAWADAVRRHSKRRGEFPNILRPKTFTDKVLHRILFERNKRLTETTDKLRARAYVEKRLGANVLPQSCFM